MELGSPLRFLEVALAQPRPADQEVRARVAGLDPQAAGRALPSLREPGEAMVGTREQEQGLTARRSELDQAFQGKGGLLVGAAPVGALVQRA
jgi:hypothetical protein